MVYATIITALISSLTKIFTVIYSKRSEDPPHKKRRKKEKLSTKGRA